MDADRQPDGAGGGEFGGGQFDPAGMFPDMATTLIGRIELEWIEAGPDRVVARIPVSGNTQPYGLLHGGATAALCETVASFGAGLRAGPERMVVGIELNVNHLRGVSSGHVTAVGTPVHQGRTTAVWSMEVRDDDGRLVAVSRLTLAVRGPAAD